MISLKSIHIWKRVIAIKRGPILWNTVYMYIVGSN